jgi:hypothetical protein
LAKGEIEPLEVVLGQGEIELMGSSLVRLTLLFEEVVIGSLIKIRSLFEQ